MVTSDMRVRVCVCLAGYGGSARDGQAAGGDGGATPRLQSMCQVGSWLLKSGMLQPGLHARGAVQGQDVRHQLGANPGQICVLPKRVDAMPVLTWGLTGPGKRRDGHYEVCIFASELTSLFRLFWLRFGFGCWVMDSRVCKVECRGVSDAGMSG